MASAYLSEIRIMGFDFNPRGWAKCDGQLLPINQNQSLYSLLGTTYGGDGQTTFGLPELRSRVAMHVGNGHPQGEKGGAATVPLTAAQIPSHTHQPVGSGVIASSSTPEGGLFAISSVAGVNPYSAATSDVNMAANTVANQGGGAGHENMQPFQALNFCICTQGVFPSQN